jgi:hypothetical protein
MVKKISKIIEAKERIAKIQMDRVEAARQKIEDVAADFKAEDLGASAKKVLNGLAKLDKHIEEKNFGLAEATIEASIKELRSSKKRIFNDAIKNLEEAVISDEEEKKPEEEEIGPEEEEITLEEEPEKSSKKNNKSKKAALNKALVKAIYESMKKRGFGSGINHWSEAMAKFIDDETDEGAKDKLRRYRQIIDNAADKALG